MVAKTFKGKRVFVTGHTGFKGAWLCEWLLSAGAKVRGYSLPPPTDPSLFAQLGLAERLDHVTGNVLDVETLRRSLKEWQPDFVFHMAAQSLVRRSYQEPIDTYATNVMGTIHVLDALRLENKPTTCVVVTTDKCYEPTGTGREYVESDRLGGVDPYSSSKAMAELAVAAYRRAFRLTEARIRVASARAGNVIGGGDWAADRLVPDCMRSLGRGQAIDIRNPSSTRPWQHVLDALSGYLCLAADMDRSAADPKRLQTLCDGFNFGPRVDASRPVSELVEKILQAWPGTWNARTEERAPEEAALLHLSIEKAKRVLGWEPTWDFATSIGKTVEWYRSVHEGKDARALVSSQLDAFASSQRDESHG